MAAPIPFDPSVETVRPDEDETAAEMIETFRTIQGITLKDYGHAVRGVHAKSHGILFGSLDIPAGLDPALAQGVFARPGRHDVILRLSTNPGDILDDSVSLSRGLALRILGVEGERLPDADGADQDFVMVNSPAFAAPDAKAFLRSLKLLAKTTDTPQIFKKALSAVLRGVENTLEAFGTKSTTVIAFGGHPETHILGETFYSQVPVRWGDYVAKVALAPVSPNLTALTGASLDVNGKPNGLRDAVTAFFRENEGQWELRAQLRTDADSMPVEDATVVWPENRSPFRTIGLIRVPAQDAWSPSRVKGVDEEVAFSPWNALSAHRPLGSVMRARRAVYPQSARFRSEHNGCPIHHPRSAQEAGA